MQPFWVPFNKQAADQGLTSSHSLWQSVFFLRGTKASLKKPKHQQTAGWTEAMGTSSEGGWGDAADRRTVCVQTPLPLRPQPSEPRRCSPFISLSPNKYLTQEQPVTFIWCWEAISRGLVVNARERNTLTINYWHRALWPAHYTQCLRLFSASFSR